MHKSQKLCNLHLPDFIAGSVGATASVYVGQPLDTIKVKMQTFPELYPRLGQCARQTLAKLVLLSILPHCILVHREGVVRGLYAGTVPSLAANVAENSILFAAYGACQVLPVNLLKNPCRSHRMRK